MALAIEQLWNWVGEQKDKAFADYYNPEKRYNKERDEAWAGAMSNVKLYMRKFFSGLIDFDAE